MKWVIVAVVVIVLAVWLARGRRRTVSDPEVKEVDQKRFYVTPPDDSEPPSEDHQGDKL